MPSRSPFPPIADFAMLSNCRTAALVAPDGSVEWMCTPRFDSPSTFGAILDRAAGSFRIAPERTCAPHSRRYEPGTMICETTWMAPEGWLVVRDALVPGPHEDATQALVRTARCIYGTVPVEISCEPRPGYGSQSASWTVASPGELIAASDGGELRLNGPQELSPSAGGRVAQGTVVLAEGEALHVALAWTEGDLPGSVDDAEKLLAATGESWREWLVRGRFPDHPWRHHLERSALILKGLTYSPTGALVAASTTSLPEDPGGERNWDYRFTWIRDATFALWGLHTLGFDDEAAAFMRFVEQVTKDDAELQIMYGIGGERKLTERTVDHLSGYDGARPVRTGNAAYKQRQNDVYGALLDAIYVHRRATGHLDEGLWKIASRQADEAAGAWREPDQGIWEARGDPKHYVSSKVMCWVALDRAARLAEAWGDDACRDRWQREARAVREEVLARGIREDGALRQHYETDALDASTLLVPLVRFLPGDDPRMRATTLAIRRELTENGMVLRYRPEDTDDGMAGDEGSFLICTLWLVSALAECGDRGEARNLLDRLLAAAGPLGLYAEELDAESGRHLGNFPQAFTHLALINAVSHVIAIEDTAEGPGMPAPWRPAGMRAG